MNEHAGPACALSGLIVGLFAFLLHDHGPSPLPRLKPTIQSASSDTSIRSLAGGLPPAKEGPGRITGLVLNPANDRVANAKVVEGPAKVVRDLEAKNPGRHPPSTAPAGLGPRPAAVASRNLNRTSLQRSTVTTVGPGESLSDVAARVYGNSAAAETLWKANRDQVERLDSPLSRGTLLRTP